MLKFQYLIVLLCAFNGISAQMLCGTQSALKQVILSKPDDIPFGGVCTYTLLPLNVNVCQVRIDFISFSLAQPTIYSYPICIDDAFIAGNVNLCGENSGNHIYVEFNATTVTPKPFLPISFKIKDRNQHPELPNPKWEVRVTQLECPPGSPRLDAQHYGTKNYPEYPELMTVKDLNENTVPYIDPRTDEYWIAPPGCLQYFPHSEGEFESFNLNGNLGPYMGDMKYSICFRRFWHSTKLILITKFFEIATYYNSNEGYDTSCFSDVYVDGRSEDYLMLPFATFQLDQRSIRGTRFCSKVLTNTTVEMEMPGPFMIYFNGDLTHNPTTASREIGFKFSYLIK